MTTSVKSPTSSVEPYILVVDEDPQIVEALVSILGNMSHQVSTAYNWETALKIMCRDSTPKLVLASAGLSDITGPELVRAIKRAKTAPEIPVILMFANEGTVMNGFDHNCQPADSLMKPFTDYQLVQEAVTDCLKDPPAD